MVSSTFPAAVYCSRKNPRLFRFSSGVNNPVDSEGGGVGLRRDWKDFPSSTGKCSVGRRENNRGKGSF